MTNNQSRGTPERVTFETKDGDTFGIRPNRLQIVNQGGTEERGIRPNQAAPKSPPPPPAPAP